MCKEIQLIDDIRRFNRYYTNILGLLEKHILNSGHSLTEARILFELNEIGSCLAHTLSTRLNIDKSYLSRVIARFERDGLIIKEVSKEDSRTKDLKLSKKGLETIQILTERSNSQIRHLLEPLNEKECNEICAAMELIKKYLIKATTAVQIRHYTDADIDFVISGQMKLYELEYGFKSDQWKSYLRDGVHRFINQFDSERDCMYILEYNGIPAGCIAITHTEQSTAQLRFFFIEAELRGKGAGHQLIDLALNFCIEKEYKHVFLWTFSKLSAARHLYEQKGFRIKNTRENSDWGQTVIEECWILERK